MCNGGRGGGGSDIGGWGGLFWGGGILYVVDVCRVLISFGGGGYIVLLGMGGRGGGGILGKLVGVVKWEYFWVGGKYDWFWKLVGKWNEGIELRVLFFNVGWNEVFVVSVVIFVGCIVCW